MRSFDYGKLKNKKWDNEIVGLVAQIHAYRAKQETMLKKTPQTFDRLVEIAKVQSTQASNEIEGIRTTSTRLKHLVANTAVPKTRDEEEIAGYRDVLNVIQENYEYIDVTSNYILQLHKMLYSHSSKSIGGKYKNVQNFISATDSAGNAFTLFKPLAPYETAPAIENICNEFNKAIADCEVDALILIPIFIHDFLCIHPFLDGNGRMSRLLTNLLLYKNGYYISKYVSLEAKIAKDKNSYYDALEKSQQGWHDGDDDFEAFIKYLLGVIVSAFRDFEDRIENAYSKCSSYEVVKETIATIVGKFKKENLLESCPSIGIKTIENNLKKLVDEGFIEIHGKGKSTFYTKKF